MEALQGPRVEINKATPSIMQRCKDLGVKFCFGSKACGVSRDRSGRISSIEIDEVSATWPTTSIPCSNLIIAAGPFTTGIYSTLFPNSHLALRNQVQHIEQLKVKDVKIRAEGDEAVSATDLISSDYPGSITLSASPTDHTAQVYVAREGVEDSSLGAQAAPKHSKGDVKSLLRLASTLVTSFESDTQINISNVAGVSRSAISTGNNACPVIGKVPSEAPGDSEGVIVAYGFGMFGTTLAPAVGQDVSQLVCNEEPTNDLTAYRIRPGSEELKPTAQGKAQATAKAAGSTRQRKALAVRVAKKVTSKDNATGHADKGQVGITTTRKRVEKVKTGVRAAAKPALKGDVKTRAAGVQKDLQPEKRKTKPNSAVKVQPQKKGGSKVATAQKSEPKTKKVAAAKQAAAGDARKNRSAPENDAHKKNVSLANVNKPESFGTLRSGPANEMPSAVPLSIQPTTAKVAVGTGSAPKSKLKLNVSDKSEPLDRETAATAKDKRKVQISVDQNGSPATASGETRPKIMIRLSPKKNAQEGKAPNELKPEDESMLRPARASTADDVGKSKMGALTTVSKPRARSVRAAVAKSKEKQTSKTEVGVHGKGGAGVGTAVKGKAGAVAKVKGKAGAVAKGRGKFSVQVPKTRAAANVKDKGRSETAAGAEEQEAQHDLKNTEFVNEEPAKVKGRLRSATAAMEVKQKQGKGKGKA